MGLLRLVSSPTKKEGECPVSFFGHCRYDSLTLRILLQSTHWVMWEATSF